MSRPDTHSAAPSVSAPRFAMLWAALAYLVATLALAYPALTGQFLVNPHSDQYIAGYAFREFAAQALRAGQGIPHWNPYLFGGMPYVAAMHGDIFYPTALLRLLMPTDAGMTWGFIIHLFLSGLFTYGFLRAWGLGFLPSLVGGFAYMLGGPIAGYASPGHDGKLFLGALLPLTLWQLLRGIRDGRYWAWGALAITVGLAWLTPHPQLLQYLLLVAGAFAVFLALGFDAHGNPLVRRVGMQRLGLALCAVLLGTAISAVQYLPVREYVAWSPRVGGHDYALATSYSFPIMELVNLYLPQFTGILDKYWGPNGIHYHSEYIGGSVLLLATLALGGAERGAFRRFWIGTLVVAALWMLGGNTPFFRLIYEFVPGTKFFRAPSTIVYVFSFAVSVLAAMGTERVLALDVNRKAVYAWLGVGGLLALLAAGGMLTNVADSLARPIGAAFAEGRGIDASAGSMQWSERATSNNGALIVGAFRSFLFLALAGAAVLAALKGKLSVGVLGIALAVVVAVDQWSIASKYWLFSSPARVLYATDPVLDYLTSQKDPGRVVVMRLASEGFASNDPYFGRDGVGTGTGLMVHGIRSVTGYHGNELGRYEKLMDARVGANATATMLPTFWRHENVQYLYTNAAVADTNAKLTLLKGPVQNSAGSTVYLYRLPGDNPYAWVAAAMTTAADAALEAAVLDPRFDPLRLAVFSDTGSLKPPSLTSLPAPATVTASTSNYGAGHATIALSAPAPAGAALVVSENYYPGWTANIDGKPQPVYRADFNLVGVPLPAGARSVELTFHDTAVDTGRTISLVAALLALVVLAAGIGLDRRTRLA